MRWGKKAILLLSFQELFQSYVWAYTAQFKDFHFLLLWSDGIGERIFFWMKGEIIEVSHLCCIYSSYIILFDNLDVISVCIKTICVIIIITTLPCKCLDISKRVHIYIPMNYIMVINKQWIIYRLLCDRLHLTLSNTIPQT